MDPAIVIIALSVGWLLLGGLSEAYQKDQRRKRAERFLAMLDED